jgi:hypothetical protein
MTARQNESAGHYSGPMTVPCSRGADCPRNEYGPHDSHLHPDYAKHIGSHVVTDDHLQVYTDAFNSAGVAVIEEVKNADRVATVTELAQGMARAGLEAVFTKLNNEHTQAYLGNATTRELLQELQSRAKVSFRYLDPGDPSMAAYADAVVGHMLKTLPDTVLNNKPVGS